ncbi:DUF3102 domain-containing protein [Desulfosporosinus fructosivorans]|uniref:DUF3102 domain-containing protein n=1 Tax=Desulfosporosinus fructosivorans TaxID=2018669 RepID=A0A4Z0R307_9FIRM|nr:DUF3102 domain-containing protein [Desulfosporosinus fructosivorans]
MVSDNCNQVNGNLLMQLFEEYGDKLFASTADGDSSNSSAPTNLTYYQAILLLGIPEEQTPPSISSLNLLVL